MLTLAGVITGLGIWTTHFTAMLGFASTIGLHFDPAAALLSFWACGLLSTLAWVTGFGDSARLRPIAAGILLAVALGTAHLLDMTSLSFAGVITQDWGLLFTALVGGAAITSLAAPLMVCFPTAWLGWPSSIALLLGTLFLHFVAMSSLNLTPLGDQSLTYGLDLSSVGPIVVAGSLVLIAVAMAFAFHRHRLAQVTLADREQLVGALGSLNDSEAHHRAYIDLNPQIQWLADPSGRILELGPKWWELTAASPAEDLSVGWLKIIHPDDQSLVISRWAKAFETGDDGIADARYRLLLKNGSYRWFRARAKPFRNKHGEIVRWYGSLEDIHEQVVAETALRESEERYRLASRASNDVIWDYSFAQDRATWTGALGQIIDRDAVSDGTSFQWWLDQIHPDDRDKTITQQRALIQSGVNQNVQEYRFRSSSGVYIWVASRSMLVRDKEGRPARLVGSMLDITARKQAEAELKLAAFHDPLTGLPNRALYQQCLSAALSSASRTGEFVGLLVVDLNDFKGLNDSMGHAAGDRLLQEVATRLGESTPEGVTVARLGGDEFAIISPGLRAEDLRMETALDRLSALGSPVTIDGLSIPIGYCAGAALFPRDADNAADLLRCADLALYAAKADLPGTIRGFKPEMRQASEHRARSLANARTALSSDSIVPFYQPKVCLRTGHVVGFEALLRWHDASGLNPPAGIADAFDDLELSVQLTDRMIDKVIADCVAWRSNRVEFRHIAINVSAADFRRGDLAARILDRLERAGLPPAVLEVEVTETVLISQLGRAVTGALETLQGAGVTIALDDFGTGFASLTHLQQFPVDVLKIDKSFIDRIGSSEPRDTAVIKAMLEMSRSMGIKTVAEGIENRAQADYLTERGCDLGQGYLYSRPVPASSVADIVEQLEDHRWQRETPAELTI